MTTKNKIVGDLPNITTADANGNIIDITLPGNVTAGANLVGSGMFVDGNAYITGNANILGNLTYNDVSTITTSNLVLGLGNTQTGINVTGGGMVVGNTNEASWLYNQPTSSWDSNIAISAAGNITGSYFIGNGSQLTGLPASYGNANVTDYLGSNSNIAITTTGNITATNFIGDGNLLTNVIAKTSIVNGNSVAQVYANGNITMSVANVANVVTVTSNSLRVNGNIYDSTGQVYGVAASFAKYTRTTTQTGVTANTVVVCNVPESLFGTDIAVDTTTGNITLQPGKAYRLRGQVGYCNLSSGGSAAVSYQWFDVTTNAWVGQGAGINAAADSSGDAWNQGTAEYVFTPSTTTVVQFRIIGPINTNSILVKNGSNYTTSWKIGAPFIDIEVIGGQAPIIGVRAANFYAGFASQPPALVAGDTIKFNGNYSSTGTDITYNATTGIFTLQPGTYSLSAAVALANSVNNLEINYVWVNVTANQQVGASGGILTAASTATAGWQPTAQATVTVTAPTQFKLYTGFVGGTPGGVIQASQSYAFINQIAGQVPVTGGTNVAAGTAKYTRTTQQTTGLTANSVIVCNVQESLFGSDITVNTTTGQVTLVQGKTYRLTGMLPSCVPSATGDLRVAVCWYNETAGAWIGNSADMYNPVSAAQNMAFGGAAEAVITPQTTTVVSFRLLSIGGSGLSALGGNSDFTTTGSYPWIDVEVIGGYAPITNARTQDYLQAVRIGTDQAAGNGTDLIFNSVTARNGNVSLDTTSGVVTLSAGTTYQLSVDPSWFQFSSNGAFLDYTWVDATSNAPLNASVVGVATPQTYTSAEANQLSATVIYTPTTNQTVKPRVTSAGAGSTANMRMTFSSITVEQIGCGYLTPNNTGSWTIAPGANTVSLSLPTNGTFTVWVLGNIPNGIVTYNATLSVTNTNVPLIGNQYGWYYVTGNQLVLTSIPNQVVGTAGGISTSVGPGGVTTNVLQFGITNNSASNQTIYWGYTKM